MTLMMFLQNWKIDAALKISQEPRNPGFFYYTEPVYRCYSSLSLTATVRCA